MYESYYINFIAPIPRHLLEDLATSALEANAQQFISKIYDQYLDFITLEDDLFSLRQVGRDSISYYGNKNKNLVERCDDKNKMLKFSFLSSKSTSSDRC